MRELLKYSVINFFLLHILMLRAFALSRWAASIFMFTFLCIFQSKFMTPHISFDDNSTADAIVRDARGVIVSHWQSQNLQFCLLLKFEYFLYSFLSSSLWQNTVECTIGDVNWKSAGAASAKCCRWLWSSEYCVSETCRHNALTLFARSQNISWTHKKEKKFGFTERHPYPGPTTRRVNNAEFLAAKSIASTQKKTEKNFLHLFFHRRTLCFHFCYRVGSSSNHTSCCVD